MGDDHDALRRLWDIRGAAAWTVAVFFVGYLLLNCSGCNFPVFGPAADLAGTLDRDFGVALPPAADVEHGGRQATLPAVRRFVVKVPPAEVKPFVDRLKAGAGRTGRDAVGRSTVTLPAGPAGPDWWAPAALTAPGSLEVTQPGRRGGLLLIYSEPDGKLLFFWYGV
jgi:hypothetical protein